MHNSCCNDERCPFKRQKGSSLTKRSFKTITKITREGEGLWERCDRCGIAINRSGVNPEHVREYYNETYVKSNSFEKDEVLTPREHFEARLGSIRRRAEYLKSWLKPDYRVFELGAGTGELLWLIKDYVSYCIANEMNRKYSDFIRNELKMDSTHEDYFKLEFEGKFDFIISLYTIDHIHDTLGAVKKVASDLKRKGLFYVEVPNDNQALKTMLPEPQRSMFQKFMYQRAHYYSFTFDTLKRLLLENGFEIVDEKCRHDYTLSNYLHWYFTGMPMKKLLEAKGDTDLHSGDTKFEAEVNGLFARFNKEFGNIITRNGLGESLCVLARKV